MFAKDASFDDALAQAYGIVWVEDLFAPADQDSRYTIDVEAFLGAQHEWMTSHLPKRGLVVEATNWGEPKLPAKAERLYGKPGKGDCTALYLDARTGEVKTAHYRMPEAKKPKGKEGANSSSEEEDADIGDLPKSRPDVTRKGIEMIGDLRTDALHDALAQAPIAEDMLTALLVLALAGRNVSIASGASDGVYGYARMERHAARLISEDGRLDFDPATLHQVARAVLIDVLSARENRTDSGVVARIAGRVIGADDYLPNMGSEDFLSCLSRQALEATCADTPVLPRQKVKDTRAALVEHFREGRFVHPSALFRPDPAKLADLLTKGDVADPDNESDAVELTSPETMPTPDAVPVDDEADTWPVAAE